MKKIIVTLLCALALHANAQSLSCTFADGSSMTVGASLNDNGTVKIIAIPLFDYQNPAIKYDIYFWSKYVKDMRTVSQCFRDVAAKWREWDKTAEENHVADMSKDMPIQTPKAYALWTGVQTWVSKAQPRSFLYSRKDNVSKVTLYGYFSALTNRLISINAVKTFTSPDDLDKLADAVELNNVQQCVKNIRDQKNLFH